MSRTSTTGDELTPDEELIIAAIEAGTYFAENIVPTGVMNGINVTFVLPDAPNPATSLGLKLNGSYIKAGGEDFTLVDDTITMEIAPQNGEVMLANYRLDPT